METSKRIRLANLLTIPVLLCLLLFSLYVHAEEVGEIQYSSGALTGQLQGQTARLLGKGQAVMQGETLSTGANSFAVVQLNDGTRMTLRPKTVFKVEQLNTNAGEENALLSLIRGGFRAITGSISKRFLGVFKVSTSVATIGIRGTEFDARICDDSDCEAENRELARTKNNDISPSKPVIARVALIKGTSWASGADGRIRTLRIGEAIYEFDHLNTGINSFAVIAFNDKTRMTLTSNSELKIQQHRYSTEKPAENSSILEFLRGGLRLVSGVIGQLNRSAFRLSTPIATIGIRGTGFDVLCRAGCASQQGALNQPVDQTQIGQLLRFLLKPAFAQGDNSTGLFTRVWNGSVDMVANGQSLLVGTNQVGHTRNSQAVPRIAAFYPQELIDMEDSPRPDEVPFRAEWFVAHDLGEKILAGLYVNVREGVVSVEGADGEEVHLTENQSGRVNLKGAVFRLNSVPGFQRFDEFPLPRAITARQEGMMNLTGKPASTEAEFECKVQ